MWMALACRKPDVMIRYHSPSATPMRSPARVTAEPRGRRRRSRVFLVSRPLPIPATKMARLTAIRKLVTTGWCGAGRAAPPSACPLRALGAVEPDGGLVHAVGADRAIAALADHPGTPVGVPVTGRGGRLHGGQPTGGIDGFGGRAGLVAGPTTAHPGAVGVGRRRRGWRSAGRGQRAPLLAGGLARPRAGRFCTQPL